MHKVTATMYLNKNEQWLAELFSFPVAPDVGTDEVCCHNLCRIWHRFAVPAVGGVDGSASRFGRFIPRELLLYY
jgi:hypothetical protein